MEKKSEKPIGYRVLILYATVVGWFPLPLLYQLSNVLSFLGYYIVRYRRGVVRENLVKSFPERSLSEIERIERDYYRYMLDMFIETIYMLSISESEMTKRCKFVNVDLVDRYFDQGRPIFVSMGHYGNWEWLSSLPLWGDLNQLSIFKPLRNISFDLYYRRVRSRFGAVMVPKNSLLKSLIQSVRDKQRVIAGFISDQTPKRDEIQHRVTFLNQETPVLLGCEKLANSFNAVVLFATMRRIKRGYYELEFTLISETPKEEPQYMITDRSMELLEMQIRKDPAYWLWSHKRWKHSR